MKSFWRAETFKATAIVDYMNNGTFVVPKYQRGLVWGQKKRDELADSIKKGLPFGSLLLYRNQKAQNFQIIDGLQRIHSIETFIKNPTYFFNEDDLDNTVVDQIVEYIGVNGNRRLITDRVKKIIVKWVKQHKTLQDIMGMQYYGLGKSLSDEFGGRLLGEELSIGEMIRPMMQEFTQFCQTLYNLDIPAIVIEGSDEYLPDIFERINSRGATLSKYEIYAATWVNERFYFKDKKFDDLFNFNLARYENFLDHSGTIDNYDPGLFLKERKLDTFEIAYGLGKYLGRKFPALFNVATGDGTKDIKKVDSIAFSLLNACLAQRGNQVSSLNKNLSKIVGQEQIERFIECVCTAVAEVDRMVGKYGKFLMDHGITLNRPLHSELQIVSLIASAFIIRYMIIERDANDKLVNISFGNGNINPEYKRTYKKLLRRNAPKIYIMDILKNNWSGSGDSRLNDILANKDYYTREVTKKDFESAIDSWFDNLNMERQEHRNINNPKEPEKLFLSCLYFHIFKEDVALGKGLDGNGFDIAYVTTKSHMRDQLGRFDSNARLPVSSIGNLCIFPVTPGKRKGEYTIYEWDDKLKKVHGGVSQNLDFMERYTLTHRSDLDWLKNDSQSWEDLKDAYTHYINHRFDVMKGKLLSYFDRI